MRTILIVEDESEVRQLLTKILEQTFSQAIDEAPTLAVAMPKLSSESLDLIILDLKLPNGHGDAVIKRIKDTRDDVPIIILSGMVDQVHKEMEFPVTSVIEKPVDFIKLKHAVTDAVETAQTIRELRENSKRLGNFRKEIE